jgi:hypothetical protein
MLGDKEMLNRPMTKLALIALTLTGLSGCGQQNSPVAGGTKIAQADTVAVKADPAALERAKNHKPVPKYGASLTYDYQMQKPIAANASHSVTIAVDHEYPGQNLSLAANVEGDLTLAVNNASLPLVKGRKASWTIPFTTGADGVSYINVIGSVKDADGSVLSRVYSVRVKVGNQPEQQKPAVKEVILPAQETIS